MTQPHKENHYVNNAQFYAAVKAYKEARVAAEAEGLKPPRMPEYIGECISKIAEKLSRSPNFRNYSYRDEMISDGIENCIVYFNSFDPDKSSNPFSYFTQCIYFAFIRRIQREKRQTYIKYKMMHNMFDEGTFFEQGSSDDGHTITTLDDSEYIKTFVKDFEAARDKKKANKREAKQEDAIEEPVTWEPVDSDKEEDSTIARYRSEGVVDLLDDESSEV